MIDMQRWEMEYERGEWDIAPDPEGQYVLLADAQAAIAAAEKRGYDSGLVKSLTIADCYEQGQRDMLAKCIAAVDAMVIDTPGNSAATVDQVIAALRALLEGETK